MLQLADQFPDRRHRSQRQMTSTLATGSISGVQARRKTMGGHVQVKLLNDVRIAERIFQVRGVLLLLGILLGLLVLIGTGIVSVEDV